MPWSSAANIRPAASSFNFALFRQEFKNFQLNTFDGTVFIVQNINGCEEDLGGTDEDQSKFATAGNFNSGAAATGACASGDVGYGVRSQGVEVEMSARVTPDLRVNAGITYADTRYRGDLVGTDDGSPLNQALRQLPGSRVSNAPSTVLTGSLAWTPPIGGSGMSGLFYIDGRHSSGFNTGSDLFPQKSQGSFTGRQRARRSPRARRPLGAGAVGAEPVRQGLSAGRVQLAVPGRRGRRSVHRPAVPGRTAALLVLPVGAADLRPDASRTVRGAEGGTGRSGTAASATAAATAGHADLPGRIGDPGDGSLPGSAAASAAAAAAARTRLIGRSDRRLGLAGNGGPFSYAAAASEVSRAAASKRRAKRIDVLGLQLPAVGAGQIEDVDRPLAIGRDVRRMEDVAAVVDRARRARRARPAGRAH